MSRYFCVNWKAYFGGITILGQHLVNENGIIRHNICEIADAMVYYGDIDQLLKKSKYLQLLRNI